MPALGVALLDVLLAMWPAPPDYRYPPALLRALGLNVIVASAALVTAGVALRPVARRAKWPAPLAAGAAVTWAWLVLLLAAPSSRLFSADLCRAGALTCGAHLARVLPPALALAPVWMIAARAVLAGSTVPGTGAITAALVPTLLVAVPAEWYVVYGEHARGLSGAWPAVAAVVLCAGTLSFVAARRRLDGPAARLTCAAALLLMGLTPVWMPAWALARDRGAGDDAGAPDLVLLLTVDALRADAVSYDPAGHTPNLARFARDATVFTRAVSPSSWTLPVFASWLTGVSPAAHLVDASGRLPAAMPTLPDVLRRHGYTTGAIVENPLFAPPSAFAGRFDEAAALTPAWYDIAPIMTMSVGPRVWSALDGLRLHRAPTSGATRLALGWLGRMSAGRAFVWVHYLAPHGPYTPTASGVARAAAAAARVESQAHKDYLGEVSQADVEIGTLLDGVRASGRYERALIIVTSDHGEELGERGDTGHGRHLHDEVLNVPLIVKAPGPPGGRSEPTRVSTQSLFATVLDACGIPYDAGAIDSPSLLGLVSGRAGAPHPEPSSWLIRFFRGGGRPQAALFLGDFKYVRLFDPDEEQVFDLRADPHERTSVAADHPDVVNQGRQRLVRERTRAESLRRTFRITDQELKAMDPDRLNALRSLGYIK